MKGNCIIPDKTETMGIISGVDFIVDTKGLCCKMKVVGGDIRVKMKEKDLDGWLLCDGEELDFCGKIHFVHAMGTPTVYNLYYHTL